MKKQYLRATLCALFVLATPAVSQAQSLFDLAKKAAQTVAGNNATAGNAIGALIGTAPLTQADLVGTWRYSEPAVVFESENLLTNAGGAVAAANVEKKMATQLQRVGFAAGKASVTFNKDYTYTCIVNGQKVSGTYEIKNNTIILKTQGFTAVKANGKLTGKQLQLSFQTNTLLNGMNALAKVAGQYDASIKSIAALASNVKGMQMGMRFAKP